MATYTRRFKERMVRKLTTPGAPSASAIAEEAGIHQTTLSRWVRQYGSLAVRQVGAMNGRRAQDWSAEQKLAAIIEFERLEESQRGEYLRHKGLHAATLQGWRQEFVEALTEGGKRHRDPRDKRIKELERDLARKEKALAETAALLTLKKKAYEIWGDPEDER